MKLSNDPNKKSSVTFYVFHLPVLLLVAAVLAVSTFVSSKITSGSLAKLASGPVGDLSYVLGDDDEGEDGGEDEGEDDKDEDKDDDKDEDKDEDSEDDNDNDSDENDDSDDDDKDGQSNQNRNTNTGTANQVRNTEREEEDEDEQENEVEDEVENEDENDDNETKTQERVQNSDGTYSIIKTETEGNKVHIETKTYDASGKLIKEEKSEGNDEGIETESEDSSGNKLKVRIQAKEALLKREGSPTGLTNFPLSVDKATGEVFVQTPKGEVRLGTMPQAIVDKAESSDDIDDVTEIELEEDDDPSNATELEYRLRAKKSEKLFGLFQVEVPATVYYDAKTGDYLRSEQEFINRILDFLSF